ncbi:MAG: hypothetical protein ACTHLH_00780 [Solirubrobacterales bacterium]
MFRQAKFFGAALLAIAALGGAGAGAASAKIVDDFTSSPFEKVIITGEQVPLKPIKYEFGPGWPLTCLTSDVNATVEHMPTTSLTLEFRHESCTLGEMAATVDTQGCRYVFEGETQENKHGFVELECTTGSKMKVTVSGCTFEIAPQTFERTGATYAETETKPRDVDVTVTTEGGLYSKVGLLCSLIGGNGSDLSINGTYTLKAYIYEGGKEGAQTNFGIQPTVK